MARRLLSNLQRENNQAKKTESREGFIIIYLIIYLFITFAFADLVNTNKY